MWIKKQIEGHSSQRLFQVVMGKVRKRKENKEHDTVYHTMT